MNNFDFNAIREKIDIVKVISHYLDVKPKGRDYVCICPFHNDTNPSLSISPEKKLFKCFVCGVGGSAFNFVQKYKNVSFLEAVKICADICNYKLPTSFRVTPKTIDPHQIELNAISLLTSFYQVCLNSSLGVDAKKYLNKDRGLSDDIIKYFKIGYALKNGTQAIQALRKNGVSVETMLKAGILSNGENLSDRNFNRIIFPISNLNGQLVGFSARKFPDTDQNKNEPKYINSPSSEIFKKGELLYNFNNAETEIKKTKIIYIVEGFMDVIAYYQAGIKNVVALMGTEMTSQHISLFQKLKLTVRLSLDGDKAGQDGIYRCIFELFKARVKCEVVHPFDGGKDAGDVFFNKGKDFLTSSINNLETPIDFLLGYYEKYNLLNTDENKAKFLQKVAPIFANSEPITKDRILNLISEKLNASKDVILNSYFTIKPNNFFESPKRLINRMNVEQNDFSTFSKIDAVSSISNFIMKNIKYENLSTKSRYISGLIRTEASLLVRIVSDINYFNIFDASGDFFVIGSFANIYYQINDIYHPLTGSLKYIGEEEYGNLIDSCSFEREQNQENATLFNKFNLCLGILERLKYCKRPFSGFNKEEFSLLMQNHLKQKTLLDLNTVDPGKNFEKWKELMLDYQKLEG